MRGEELEAAAIDVTADGARDGIRHPSAVDGGHDLEHVEHPQHGARVVPFGAKVVEGDHRLDGSARRIRPGTRDIAPHRPDVFEHPRFVPLLLADALVQVVAHVAESVVAARGGDGHHRAEMPDDVIQVVQERAVLRQRQPMVNHRMHLRDGLELATARVGHLDQRDEERRRLGLFDKNARQAIFPLGWILS